MKRRFTQSEFNTYRRCKRRWWLGYYRKLRPIKFTPSAASQGTLFHTAMEAIGNGEDWREALEANAAEDKSRADDIFHQEIDDQQDLARIMVEGYIEWSSSEGIDAYTTLLASEAKMERDMGSWILMGKYDELRQRDSDGSQYFRDYKTGALADLIKGSQINEQFRIYQLIHDGVDDVHATGGEWIGARKVKRTKILATNPYDHHFVKFNRAQLATTETRVNILADEIMHAERVLAASALEVQVDTMYPTPQNDWTCFRCEFFFVCPMMDSGDDWKQALQDLYEQGDPLARYRKEETK